jgi:hypothetical protein
MRGWMSGAGVEKGRRWATDDQETTTPSGEAAFVRTEWDWRHYSQLFCTRDDARLWYSDEKVANREVRVWHGATEKAP